MKDRTTILEAMRRMVAERLCVDLAEVDPDSAIVNDLGLESQEIVGLLIQIEESYPPLAFEDIQQASPTTLRALADYIAAHCDP